MEDHVETDTGSTTESLGSDKSSHSFTYTGYHLKTQSQISTLKNAGNISKKYKLQPADDCPPANNPVKFEKTSAVSGPDLPSGPLLPATSAQLPIIPLQRYGNNLKVSQFNKSNTLAKIGHSNMVIKSLKQCQE